MENRYIDLTTESAVLVDGYVWFSNAKYNGLFKMGCDSKIIEYVSIFPEAGVFKSLLHRKCIYIQDYRMIAFLPWYSDWLHLYDLNSGTIKSIYINRKGKESVSGGLYYDGCIYLFPVYDDQDLCIVSLTDYSVEVDASFRNQCKDVFKVTDRNPMCVVHDYVYYDDKIWFSVVGTSDLYNWNYKTRKLNKEHINIQSIYSITSIESGLLILSTIFPNVWKYDSNGLEEIVVMTDNIKVESETYNTGFFSGIIPFGEKIYILSDKLERGFCLSDSTCYELFFEGKMYFENKNDYARTLIATNDEILMFPQKGNCGLLVLRADADGEKIDAFSMNSDDKYLKRIKSELSNVSIVMRESDSTTIYDYISILA